MVNYDRRAFIRLATGLFSHKSKQVKKIIEKLQKKKILRSKLQKAPSYKLLGRQMLRLIDGMARQVDEICFDEFTGRAFTNIRRLLGLSPA